VTDTQIKALNKRYLNRERATDVLAFDLKEGRCGHGRHLDGEIVVSAVTARRNAKRFNTTPWHEMILYIAHGILHLIGYDDHAPGKIERMRKKEKEIMLVLGLSAKDQSG